MQDIPDVCVCVWRGKEMEKERGREREHLISNFLATRRDWKLLLPFSLNCTLYSI